MPVIIGAAPAPVAALSQVDEYADDTISLNIPANQYASLASFQANMQYTFKVYCNTDVGQVSFSIDIDTAGAASTVGLTDVSAIVTRYGWGINNSTTRELYIQFNRAVVINNYSIVGVSTDSSLPNRIRKGPILDNGAGIGVFQEPIDLTASAISTDGRGVCIAASHDAFGGQINVPEGPTVSAWFNSSTVIPEIYRGEIVTVFANAFCTFRSSGFVEPNETPVLISWFVAGSIAKRDRVVPRSISNTMSIIQNVPMLSSEFLVPGGTGDYTLSVALGWWKENAAHSVIVGGSENGMRMGVSVYRI